MATRYSKWRMDGSSIGHYDSIEEMNADVPDRPGLFDFSIFCAVIGCIVFFAVACIAIRLGVGDTLPKWARFASVFAAAGIGCGFIGYIGELLFRMFVLVVLVGIIGGIVTSIWHFV